MGEVFVYMTDLWASLSEEEEEPAAADPIVEPGPAGGDAAGFLRKCLKCGQVAYLRKNGCANPDCVT